MHAIYHTSAVIIKSQPYREADKLYWVFTEDFGLVHAVATGVRKADAKLKGQLVDYAFVDVDLVKGRDVWRLVSATIVETPLATMPSALARPYVRLLSTIERFLVDEGAHPEVFGEVRTAARAARDGVDPKAFDVLSIWRVLVALGYIAVAPDEAPLANYVFPEALSVLSEAMIKRLVRVVNHTITQTHL